MSAFPLSDVERMLDTFDTEMEAKSKKEFQISIASYKGLNSLITKQITKELLLVMVAHS